MKIPWNKLFNFLFLILAMVLLAGFQNTFWFQLFGSVPAPMLWLCLVVYVTLNRKLYRGLFTVYVLGLAIMGFTVMPMKMLLISLFLVYFILYSIRSRVFWEGPVYYTIMCTLAAFSYHVIYFFHSWIFEKNPAPVDFLDRFVQLLLTPAFCFPLFWLLTRIDKMTSEEMTPESRGLEL